MLIFSVALFSCAVLILLLRKEASRFGIVDHPGGRKQHKNPTPTVGGLAMFGAVLVALLAGNGLTGEIKVLMVCAAALVILGVFDDRCGLSVKLRMIIEVMLVLLVIINAEGKITHLGALFGSSEMPLGLLAVPFSLIAFVGGINAMNMIDGVDGMAGNMALITTIGVASIFYLSGAVEALPLTLAMIGALIGFLLFNERLFVRRAWVFMGDAGSMWLGLVLGWFMAQITRGEVAAEQALVLWLFGLPLIDTLVVMIRRWRCKCSPFAADRTHIHHELQRAGLSVKRTVLVLSLVQLVLVGIGVFLYFIQASAAVVFWSFVLLVAAYYYRFRHCRCGIGQRVAS